MDSSPTAPQPAPLAPPLPPGLKALQWLVTALTLVMIAGFVVMIVAFVMRLGADGPTLPAALDLPEGRRAIAFTQGGDWLAVVTDDDRILIYDRLTARLRQEIALD